MRLVLPEDATVTRALQMLDRMLPSDFPKLRIKIVGGYALIVLGVRRDVSEATDLDYIGPSLPQSILGLVDEIGDHLGLGPRWLNNDVTMSGHHRLSDIEHSTGPLHFYDIETELLHFDVEVPDAESLLRMKLVSLDTQLVIVVDSGKASDFTRFQDFTDIRLICEFDASLQQRMPALLEEMGDDGRLLDPHVMSKAVKLALAATPADAIIESLVSDHNHV